MEKIDCKICNNTGYTFELVETEYGYSEEVVKDCVCLPKRKILHTINTCGLKQQFSLKTFETYKATTEWQRIMLKRTKDYTFKTLSGEKGNLVLSGAVGSGKTHLAIAVVKPIIDAGFDFKYISFNSYFGKIQKDIKNFAPDLKATAEYNLKELQQVDVLFIDDFGKNDNFDLVFDLIDERYLNNKMTIITTEITLDELMKREQAIASRIFEKTNNGMYWVDIKDDGNRNYRLKGVRV